MEAEERVEQAVAIVAAYVAHNSVPAAEMPGLIAAVHVALSGLGQAPAPEEPPAPKLAAGQIRRSITPEALISFEDGKPYKTLRRHLAGKGLTPEAYRAKWGLPTDYPMVAASYSEQRSALAQSLGLGRVRVARTPEPERAPEASLPARRGRRTGQAG